MTLKQFIQSVPSHQRAQVARELTELAKKKQDKNQSLDFNTADLLEFSSGDEATQQEIEEISRLIN
ncbi:hypothetical protein CLV24_11982 [Pontibacter ummariensis]|uniref:Uncharacterized protein n=1 Tax=Pontibacter ummariensis TaxID=1610492 RepID=A0A239IZB8_9BACT|nr:hypothetical protein [Pontibacter ummariensis]PRY09031.1 hypothetical protein CLV24_11982 [Pontibacter ummariensis]SNS98732.1 hypothetical protein SAMN06296052_11982 [Pontibacter ummariensis]